MFKKKSYPTANTGSRGNVNAFSKSIDQDKLAKYLNRSGQFDLRDSNGGLAKHPFGLPEAASDSEQESSDEDSEALYDGEDDVGPDEEEYEGTMDVDMGVAGGLDVGSPTKSPSDGSMANGSVDLGSSILNGTPRGVKRSRGGVALPFASSLSPKKPSKPKQESAIPAIANFTAARLGVAELEEPDDFIISTEHIIERDLYGTAPPGNGQAQTPTVNLPKVSESLSHFWRSAHDQHAANLQPKGDTFIGIGPNEDEAPLSKAVFVGAMLLQLRHPPEAKGKQALAVARLNRSAGLPKSFEPVPVPSNPTAFPKVLVDWLDHHHNPYHSTVTEVMRYQPSPAAHYNYWDIVSSLTLRGKLADVALLLKRANFQHARTAKEDGQGSDGYHGIQLKNIDRVINRASQVLELCPTLQDDNWNVTGNEWTIFRKRIEQAIDDLAIFAEGRDRDMASAESTLEASNFGLRRTTMGLSQSTRKAESRVPWQIYQNLKAIYGIILGGTTEIMAQSQDWVEATIGLTVWWAGDDDEDVPSGSLALTRRSLRQSNSRLARLVDVNPHAAYLRQLAHAFESVTDDSDEDLFQINSINPVEVGLASVFEGNVEGVIGLLRGWSLPVASAIAEIASAGGWFESSIRMSNENQDLLLDISDLGQGPGGRLPMTKDSILVDYAKRLSAQERIQATQGGISLEGWELSISVLNRLDVRDFANKMVGQLLDDLPFESDERIEKILRTCKRFRLDQEGHRIAEVGHYPSSWLRKLTLTGIRRWHCREH